MVFSDIIIILIVPILIPIITSALIMWGKRVVDKQNENIDKDNFNVTFNKLGLAAMTFLVVFLAVSVTPFIVLYFVYDDMPIWALIGACIGCGVCTIIALILEIMMYRWKICVLGDAVTFIPLAGKKREYNLNELSHVHVLYSGPSVVKYSVYFKGSGKKAFVFNNLMVGANLFEQKLLEYSSF